MMNDDPSQPETKSQRKRQMLALQQLGATLVELSAAQLAKIPLEQPLLDAVNVARELKSHEAKRRQLQYIGKLMRKVDPEPIQKALTQIQGHTQQSKVQFHQVERWRDKLIAEGDEALQALLAQHPNTDRQHVRQLIRKAQQDKKNNKNTGGETELFRYLRTLLK